MLNKNTFINYTKDIVIAKMSNTTAPPCKETGEAIAEMMQVIYDKFVETCW